MQKVFNFLIVGLTFAVLNVATVAADIPSADTSAAPIGEGGEAGGPAAQDMSGNMINDGGHGANSGADAEAEKAKAVDACLTRSCVGVSPEYGGPEGCRKNDLTIRQCKAEVFGGHSNDYR